jgi:hypothetical protein
MTDEQKLAEATKLIEEVWNVLVPDRPSRTVVEEAYFDFIDRTATRIISDIDEMYEFLSDIQL